MVEIGYQEIFSKSHVNIAFTCGHRIRYCFIKQWRKAKTTVINLLGLGVDIVRAAYIGASSKG
ncbi:hypothetical protein ACH42_07595 [Endozoicomonas sp. (ex Bugula neritina AB1)]|nr:hypothetical protein ACH42_07595 [Endozoicomonas sp. (ex Bugula neritina AB1)]